VLEPHVWRTAPGASKERSARDILNIGAMGRRGMELVEIGDQCMLANALVSDGSIADDRDRPVPWQGFTSRGDPTPPRGEKVGAEVNVVIRAGSRWDALGDRRELGRDLEHPAVSIARVPGKGAGTDRVSAPPSEFGTETAAIP